jgi:hypothetical protein
MIVPVDLMIFKSYNSNRNVEWAKWHISSLPLVKIIVRQKIWHGRRDANMPGGGGEMAAAPGTTIRHGR